MKRFLTLLLLLSLSYVAGAQGIIQRAGPANTVEDWNLAAKKLFLLPRYTDTTAATTVMDSCGALIFTRSDGKVWKRLCSPKKWEEIGSGSGGGGSTTKVDSVTTSTDSTRIYYWVNGSRFNIVGLTAGVTGGDTTIFATVLDSTGQANNKVLFSKNRKISSDNYFLWDDVNHKLVVNHNNISVGGANTKLFVKGNANLTDAVTVGGQLTNTGITVVGDTTLYKPVGVDASGNMKKLDKWPTSGTASADTTISKYPLFTIVTPGQKDSLSIDTSKIAGAVATFSDLQLQQQRLIDSAAALQVRLQAVNDTVTNHNTRLIGKQTNITLTTTGTSGASTFNQSTGALNIPNYAGGAGGSAKAYSPLVVRNDSIYQRFNVLAYGADPTGVADATTAIQAAINAANIAGGGEVYFPNGTYIIAGARNASSNSQIQIPNPSSSPGRGTIILKGESTSMTAAPGGLLEAAATQPPVSGVVLKSTLSTFTAAGQAVIGSAAGNTNSLVVEDINIQVKNNPSGTGPVVGGISWKNGYNFSINRFSAYVDTSGYYSTLPQNDVSGIETPDNGRGQNYSITNTEVAGFRSGIKLGEHVVLKNVNAIVCYYGMNFKTGSHSTTSIRSGIYWCAYNIYIGGSSIVSNFKFDSEWQQVGKWFDDIATVKDSANLAKGQLFYSIVEAGVGLNDAKFTKSGGLNLYSSPDQSGVAGFTGITNNQNAATSFKIENTTSGGSAQPYLHLKSTTLSGYLGIKSPTSTALGSIAANDVYLLADNTPLNISTTSSSPLKFSTSTTGSPIERARITGIGNFLIGSTTDDAANILQVTGATKITGAFNATGAGTIGNGLSITGGMTTTQASTIGGNLSVTGNITSTGNYTPSGNIYGQKIALGSLAAPTDPLYIVGASSGNVQLLVENTTSTGQANTRVKNNAGSLAQMGLYGSTATAYGAIASGSAYIYSSSPSSLTLMSDHSTAPVIIATGAGGVEKWRVSSAGYLSNTGSTGTAYVHIKAGTATANTAPFKFTAGTNLTTPEAGAVEFDGTDYYITSGSVRYKAQRVGTVPASATATGVTGTIAYDSSFIYVCVATNTWVRAALATW